VDPWVWLKDPRKDLASGVLAVETITASLMRLLLEGRVTVSCLSWSWSAASHVDKEKKQGHRHQ